MTQVCVENHSEEPQTELLSMQELEEVVKMVKKTADEHSGDHGVGRELAPLPAMATATTTCIEKPQAQVYLGSGRDDELMEGWYLDTGATNHMTGRCTARSSLVTGRSWPSRALAPSSSPRGTGNTRP
jgi:hypothetical protein